MVQLSEWARRRGGGLAAPPSGKWLAAASDLPLVGSLFDSGLMVAGLSVARGSFSPESVVDGDPVVVARSALALLVFSSAALAASADVATTAAAVGLSNAPSSPAVGRLSSSFAMRRDDPRRAVRERERDESV